MYTVEKIFGKRFNEKTGKFEYHVKWQGYSYEQTTWEPQNHLKYVTYLIDQYNREAANKIDPQSKDNNAKEKNSKDNQNGEEKHYPIIQKTKKIRRKGGKTNQKTQKIKVEDSSDEAIQNQQNSIVASESHRQNKNQKEISSQEPLNKPKVNQNLTNSKNPENGNKNLWNHTHSNSEIMQPHDQQEEQFRVVGLCRRGTQLIFKVQVGNQKKWMRREQVIEQHSIELCQFYEKHLSYI